MGATEAAGAVDGDVVPGVAVPVGVGVAVAVGATAPTVSVDDGEVTGEPDGGSPETVAESPTVPLSTSVWATV